MALWRVRRLLFVRLSGRDEARRTTELQPFSVISISISSSSSSSRPLSLSLSLSFFLFNVEPKRDFRLEYGRFCELISFFFCVFVFLLKFDLKRGFYYPIRTSLQAEFSKFRQNMLRFHGMVAATLLPFHSIAIIFCNRKYKCASFQAFSLQK